MPMALAAIIALLQLPISAEVIHDDIYLRAGDAAIVFGNSAIQLAFDPDTGHWRHLQDRRTGALLLNNPDPTCSFDVRIDDNWLCPSGTDRWQYAGRRIQRDGPAVILRLRRQRPGWRAMISYKLWPREAVIARTFQLTPTQSTTGAVNHVRLSLNGVGFGQPQDTTYSILGNWPPQRNAFASLTPGNVTREHWGGATGGYVIVHNPDLQLGLVAALTSTTESFHGEVLEGSGNIRITHQMHAAYYPQEGETETFGTQFIAVATGDREAALRQGRRLYDFAGLTPPKDMLHQAQESVFYSAHVGGTIDSGFRDVGGFAEFAEYLPQLKRLGITELWLLPFWKGNVYAPVDYYALDPRLGTVGDLKALVDQAHALGIRVLGDLIPHGPLDESGLHKQHPDWITRKPDGTMQYWWGCLSCDYAHPGWQRYMAEHAAHWVEKVGLDGYRVDCAAGGPYNWEPYDDNRPSMSGLYGGLQVLRAAREQMQNVKDEVLLLAEATGPAFLRHADYAYDWPLSFGAIREFPRWRTDEFVPALARWLQNEQYFLPRDANLIHFLENHDTVRARMMHGPGCERALLALCAFIPGTPFIYHFEEIGMAPYLSRLYAVRRQLPELMHGEAEFLAFDCTSDNVLAFARYDAEHATIVTINFSQDRQNFAITVPARFVGSDGALQDALNPDRDVLRSRHNSFELALEPFGTAVLAAADREISLPAPQYEPAHFDAAPPEVVPQESAVTVRNGAIELEIDRDRGGLIRSLSGPDGHNLLTVKGFAEGQRRLWLHPDRLALETRPADDFNWTTRGDATILRAAGTAVRATDTPVADYQITYEMSAQPAVTVRYKLTAREPINNVLGSLVEEVALDSEATEWYVPTVEGPLRDRAIARRPTDRRYAGRYWHGVGDRVWQSCQWPADEVWLRSQTGAWYRLTFHAADTRRPDNIQLKMRAGDAVGPHLNVQWLDGRQPVNLESGDTLAFAYTIELMNIARPHWRPPHIQAGNAVRLRVRGSRYEIANDHYQLAVTRFGGGRMSDLRPIGADTSLITDSEIYTDTGIYAKRVLPAGQQVRNHVSSSMDPEAELTFTTSADQLSLQFEGILRSHDGRSIPRPTTRYRTACTVDNTDTLKAAVAVRTNAHIEDAEAFLAQRLHLPRFASFRVNAADGVTSDRPRPGEQRVWQSKVAGFAQQPWMECNTGTGYRLRFAGPHLATAFQNAFLFRGGGTSATVFLAFNDGEPADIEPMWRHARYAITLYEENE